MTVPAAPPPDPQVGTAAERAVSPVRVGNLAPVSAPGPPRPSRVTPTPLAELAELAGLAGLAGAPPAPGDQLVTGITHDSRAVRPGDIYAALPGAHAHGASFAAEAAAAGAVALLTDARGAALATGAGLPAIVVPDPRAALGPVSARVYGDPSGRLAVHGVTGTNGKTTTAYLLEAGFAAAGHRTGLIGTIETRVAGERLGSTRTTPEAPDLQALLALMVERGVTAVAMEVSSHALALGRVDGTHFATATFTNLSQDHLDFHADMEDYFAAKASLFTADRCAAAVVDVDDGWGVRLADAVTGVPVARVGAHADWRIERREPGAFVLHRPDGLPVPASTRLLGAFNTDNAALALTALLVTGLPEPAAVQGIAELAGVPGRAERVEEAEGFLAVVDYAHTPDAVTALLGMLRPLTAGRLIAVLGCGGDRDRAKRPLMGAAVAAGADLAVLTDDNPRSEASGDIIAAMRAGISAAAGAEVLVEPDRRAAIWLAVARARPGDTVVVAGKGHESGQEVAGVVAPFDDRVVLREALAGVAA